ncbi:MAG: hypothetical protein IPP62_18620 [bacterium]|nr:hypothetical protein [bacterium]
MKDKLESLAQSAGDCVGGGAGAVRDAVGRFSEIGTLSPRPPRRWPTTSTSCCPPSGVPATA